MKKKVWANAVWFLFHTLAEKIKPEACTSSKELTNLYQQISLICANLPCPDCQGHAMNYLSRVNVSQVTATKENLIVFLWQFHNHVNARTKAPFFTRIELDAKYKLANTPAIIQNFIHIMSSTTNNSKLMLQAYHRQNFMKKFIEYILLHYILHLIVYPNSIFYSHALLLNPYVFEINLL